jgi:hypothetical protein
MRKAYKSVLVAVPISLAIALPSLAGKVRYVSIESALEGDVPIVVSAEGGGVNIDFGQTDEEIYKVRIDDPSRVVIDHCLVTKSCQDGKPEPNIALFRVDIPQEDIPAVKTTQLTVLTRDKSGQSNTYIFPVTVSSKPSPYNKFVIGSSRSIKSNGAIGSVNVAAGVARMESNKTLVDPQLKGRASKFVQLVEQGVPARRAAIKAGISSDLRKRIEMESSVQLKAEKQFRGALLSVPDAPIPVRQQSDQVLVPPHQEMPKKTKRKAKQVVLKSDKPLPPSMISSATVAVLPKAKVFVPTRYKSLTAHVLANAISNGLIVAYNKNDSSITSKRYKFNTAIRKFRAQKTSQESAISKIPGIAKASGLTIQDLEKVLVYAGIPHEVLKQKN